MYYPYLRGKQFELIAIREFVSQNPKKGLVIPIIEPVKSSLNSLTMAVEAMQNNDFKFALVLNPSDGDFRRVSKDFLTELPSLAPKSNKWIPAFLYQGNEKFIMDEIKKKHLNDIMVIFKDGVSINPSLTTFLTMPEIKYIVDGDTNHRAIKRIRKDIGPKSIIRLDNCFEERPRNIDYLPIEDELFTEEYWYYYDDGFYGISDYTILPKKFSDGGMLPYAIAIHVTYLKDEAVYVRHFVSDTNDDQSNIQRKFFEATRKLKEFFENNSIPKTNAIEALISLLDEEKYPGLGVIKKLSIRNHMELIHQILQKK